MENGTIGQRHKTLSRYMRFESKLYDGWQRLYVEGKKKTQGITKQHDEIIV